MFPVLHPLPGPHYKVIKHQNILKDFFRQIFIQHREVLDENDRRSYIDAFMSKMEGEKNHSYSHFHEMNLLCTVTNLFVAGTETTSSTLSWALLILIKHPNIQIHRDKNHWEKPDHFYPPHFLNEQGKFVKREAFMPFSAGRRVCVGETLARMELFLFFTSLLQNFSFHAAEGVNGEDIDLSPTGGLTLSAPNIQVRALARNRNV
ncbi:hypothetical protein ANANG_G00122850 [Anguilla anguilla]|uniref:Uncharacterized protein n=1 Tax=Anguilla anguilla TaxID=7936 RepID=A0A9D3RXA8_ANGAN|nr:hypothetical protein ANANG_G00122850 [Anguilla anguilla]